MKKWIVRLVIIFVLLLIVGLIAAFLSLNTLVKTGVEKIGPRVTQTDVKLESANISPFSGSGELKGLVVGNPPGFKTPSAMQLGHVKVAVDIHSVLSNVVIVDSVDVDSPEVTFEGGIGGNNLSKLLDNVNSVAGTDDSGKAKAPASKPAEGGKKFKIKDLVIRNVKVNASLTGMGGKTVSLTIPEIHLTNIGSDENGVSTAELTQRLIHEILVATTKALGNAPGALGKEVQGLGKDAGSTIQKATKGFKGLFKR